MISKIIAMSLAACILIPAVLSELNNLPTDRTNEIVSDIGNNYEIPLQYVNNIEDIRYLKNVIDAYRNINRRLVNVEGSNDQDSKYQVWKRNADIINTLLGIPRRMLEIGR